MSAVAVYAGIYLLALVPGLPLGFALFGSRQAAGWVAGGLLGYVLTALAIWAPIQLGVPSAGAFAIGWAASAALAWLVARGLRGPLVTLPPWTRRDTLALAMIWLLALAIAVPPLARVGASDASGARHYRAYFTADFVWHTALTSELAKFTPTPRNPYLASEPIHYYWTYFLLPAGVAGTAPRAFADVETGLKVNAVGAALLFVSAIFIAAWTALPRAWPVAAGVALCIVASSAEGMFAVWRFWQQAVPLAEVRNLNIDAISNWWPPHGLRIDGLPRCFWWVPQHSMAYALGLVALGVVNRAGSGAPTGAIGLAGAALAGSVMMNPFVGGIFSIVWGSAVALDAARAGDFARGVLRHSVAAIPVALALAWCIGNQMVEGAALQLGWLGDARHTTPANLLLSLGPALAAAAWGLTLRPAAPLLLACLSLLLLYLVRLEVEGSWVGFRAGQMFLVAVPPLIARGLVLTGTWGRLAMVTALLALLTGAPTTIIDTYNAQDITNFSESPNGPWTMRVTRDVHEGVEWLRRTTPASAIVQMEPIARGRRTWSLIPSFAQRRMSAGQPISLLGGIADGSEYAVKSMRVKAMYETGDARQAWETARVLRIDYIWVDGTERAAYPAGVAKFDGAPEFFAPAFKNADVTIFHVQ